MKQIRFGGFVNDHPDTCSDFKPSTNIALHSDNNTLFTVLSIKSQIDARKI